jgi:deoxyribose-phosphate aldolase
MWAAALRAIMQESVARLIDHALLHPTLTDRELRAGCELAQRLRAASVCIKPYAVPLAAQWLTGSETAVCTVIGFPHGSPATEVKRLETQLACEQGAREVDMVVNVGKVLSEDWSFVEADVRAVVDTAHAHGALAKVIFENEYLPDDGLKIELCRICSRLGADFVKTSTGFGFVQSAKGGMAPVGATDHDLKLMRAHTDARVGVKASGGVRTYQDALRVIALGATRIGTSSTEAIVVDAHQRVVAHQVDVVVEHHDVAFAQVGIQPAAGVRHDQQLDAQGLHHAHGQRDLLQRIALVQMKPPVHRDDRRATHVAAHEPAVVREGRRTREVRDVRVVDHGFALDLVGKGGQPRAQDDAHPGSATPARSDGLKRVVDLLR